MKKIFSTLIMWAFGIMPVIAQQQEVSAQQQPAETKTVSPAPLAAVAIPMPSNNQIQKLADVKKIFVTPLGTSEGSELIRQKLINSLVESKVVAVVDSPDDADAILTGIGLVHSDSTFLASGGGNAYYPGYGSSNYHAVGGTHYSASLTVRLVGKGKQILWTGQSQPKTNQTRPRKLFGIVLATRLNPRTGSVTSNAVNDVVNALTEAIKKDQEATQISNTH